MKRFRLVIWTVAAALVLIGTADAHASTTSIFASATATGEIKGTMYVFAVVNVYTAGEDDMYLGKYEYYFSGKSGRLKLYDPSGRLLAVAKADQKDDAPRRFWVSGYRWKKPDTMVTIRVKDAQVFSAQFAWNDGTRLKAYATLSMRYPGELEINLR